jgi:hypothetical protein
MIGENGCKTAFPLPQRCISVCIRVHAAAAEAEKNSQEGRKDEPCTPAIESQFHSAVGSCSHTHTRAELQRSVSLLAMFCCVGNKISRVILSVWLVGWLFFKELERKSASEREVKE